MKIDHIVANIDRKYQKEPKEIEHIREAGFLYEPKYGKGTRGFKATNIWIGNEYFELIALLKPDGGGWRQDWVNWYNKNHRGIVCVMIDVDDLDRLFQKLCSAVDITKPEYLEFKWFFGLLTRRMPWRNAYVAPFSGANLQIGFQEMKDDKSRQMMEQYMFPNSRENGIDAISQIELLAPWQESDFDLIEQIFDRVTIDDDSALVRLNETQALKFTRSKSVGSKIQCMSSVSKYAGRKLAIENMEIEILGR